MRDAKENDRYQIKKASIPDFSILLAKARHASLKS
jgi:hypothetical protein